MTKISQILVIVSLLYLVQSGGGEKYCSPSAIDYRNKKDFKDEISKNKGNSYKKVDCTCYLQFTDQSDNKCKIGFKEVEGKDEPDCEYVGKVYSKYDIQVQKDNKEKYLKYNIRMRPYFRELDPANHGQPQISKIIESTDDGSDTQEYIGMTLELEALDYNNVVNVSPSLLAQFMEKSLSQDPNENDPKSKVDDWTQEYEEEYNKAEKEMNDQNLDQKETRATDVRLYKPVMFALEDYKFCYKNPDEAGNLDDIDMSKCNICSRLCDDSIDMEVLRANLRCAVSDEVDLDDENPAVKIIKKMVTEDITEEEEEEKKKKEKKKPGKPDIPFIPAIDPDNPDPKPKDKECEIKTVKDAIEYYKKLEKKDKEGSKLKRTLLIDTLRFLYLKDIPCADDCEGKNCNCIGAECSCKGKDCKKCGPYQTKCEDLKCEGKKDCKCEGIGCSCVGNECGCTGPACVCQDPSKETCKCSQANENKCQCKEKIDCKDDPYIPDPEPDCNTESENYPSCIKPPPNKCRNGALFYPRCKDWDTCQEGSISWPGCNPDKPDPCETNAELFGCVKFCDRYPNDRSCNIPPTPDECKDKPMTKGCEEDCKLNKDQQICKVQDPDCKTEPEKKGCYQFCKKNPKHPSCPKIPEPVPGKCSEDPMNKPCPKYCQENPKDQECIDIDPCLADPSQEGCPDYCKEKPEEKICIDFPKDSCQINPLQEGCPAFCLLYPSDDSCKGPIPDPKCKKNPEKTPGCPEYCEANPDDEACKKDKCKENPEKTPGCPEFCEQEENKKDSSCRDIVCEKEPEFQGCPEYCKKNPMDRLCWTDECISSPMQPGCPQYCEEEKKMDEEVCKPIKCKLNPDLEECTNFCKENPNDPSCIIIPGPDPDNPCTKDPKSEACYKYCKENPDAEGCKDNDCIKDPKLPGCYQFCKENPTDEACTDVPPIEDEKVKKFLLEDNECDFDQFNKREILNSYPNQEYLTQKELETRFAKKGMTKGVMQFQQIRNDMNEIISNVGENNKDENFKKFLRFKKQFDQFYKNHVSYDITSKSLRLKKSSQQQLKQDEDYVNQVQQVVAQYKQKFVARTNRFKKIQKAVIQQQLKNSRRLKHK